MSLKMFRLKIACGHGTQIMKAVSGIKIILSYQSYSYPNYSVFFNGRFYNWRYLLSLPHSISHAVSFSLSLRCLALFSLFSVSYKYDVPVWKCYHWIKVFCKELFSFQRQHQYENRDYLLWTHSYSALPLLHSFKLALIKSAYFLFKKYWISFSTLFLYAYLGFNIYITLKWCLLCAS